MDNILAAAAAAGDAPPVSTGTLGTIAGAVTVVGGVVVAYLKTRGTPAGDDTEAHPSDASSAIKDALAALRAAGVRSDGQLMFAYHQLDEERMYVAVLEAVLRANHLYLPARPQLPPPVTP